MIAKIKSTITAKYISPRRQKSERAFADYKANPDAYFGRIELSSTKPLTDSFELFEWFMKTHQHLTTDELL